MLPARPTESVGADRPLILEIVRERERTGTRSSLAHWPVGSAAKRVESAPALGCSGRSGGLPAHELTNRVTAYSHSTLLASHHDLALNPLAHFRIFSSRPPGTDRNPSSSIARPGRDLDGSHQLSDAESRPSHDTSRKHNKTQNSRVCILRCQTCFEQSLLRRLPARINIVPTASIAGLLTFVGLVTLLPSAAALSCLTLPAPTRPRVQFPVDDTTYAWSALRKISASFTNDGKEMHPTFPPLPSYSLNSDASDDKACACPDL